MSVEKYQTKVGKISAETKSAILEIAKGGDWEEKLAAYAAARVSMNVAFL